MLDSHRWSVAYYVAGYAVECGLKACVLVRVAATPEVIFDNKRFSEHCWTHNLADLVKQADLETARLAAVAANPAFLRNWFTVKDWSEQARYETHPHHKAKRLYAAIADQSNGVMPWVRMYW